ncbi:S8 family serine peptidase [bacterium]|nr:S8 family serine peptidase [bacterium]
MKRSFHHKFRLIVLIFTSCFTLTASAGNIDDFDGIDPGQNVETGQIYIQISREAAPLAISTYDGIISTGIPSLDAVSDAFGVYEIEKTFRMKSTPSDPTIPDLSRYYTIYFPEDYGPFTMMEAYESCEEVIFTEFVTIDRYIYIPNDTRFRNQWHLEQCNLPDAWDVTHGSEEIIIGIVDGGLDMNTDGYLTIHEDFPQNLWINPGEDIDNDGVITLDDWDGEDNDGNDYADDFYGWDFSGRDNWPDDYWGVESGHGTHVAGLASAATDNETGIAGAGFNCKLMITAHYSIYEPHVNVAGNRGIEYCADNGADIINLSWGSYGPGNQVNQAAVLYAQRQGAIIFAGAGNDDAYDRRQDNHHFYPCAYDGVIGVGATDNRDYKANFSNYGDYIDVITPGVAMLSAYPRNSYAALQGTSMSSPFAAGIGALLLSVEPDLAWWEMLEWMDRTAVDISEVGNNDQYPGIDLRLDAGFLLNSTHPDYELLEWELIEVEGDQDLHIERNETFSFNFTISNTEGYADANNVVISMETNDKCLSILTDEINIGDLDNGDSYELWEDEYPTFRVNGNSTIHYSNVSINITSDEGYEKKFDFPLTIRHPHFLLMDDDDGDTYETYYHEDMLERRIVHNTWDVADKGLLSQDEINNYGFVIWETGNDETPLTQSEQELISGYLDRGGFMLLSGQFIGDDIGDSEFHRNYLKANHVSDNTRGRELVGNANNPITEGIEILIIGGKAGNGTLSPSSMEPIDGAVSLFNYTNGEQETAGIYYAGDYTLVYMGFAFEAISGGGETTMRVDLHEKILDHFRNTGVDDAFTTIQPTSYEMSSPMPNPFNSRTMVSVNVPEGADYTLEVLDLTGRRIEVLHDGQATAGRYSYNWNAESLPAGVYLFNLSWAHGSIVKKVVLIK